MPCGSRRHELIRTLPFTGDRFEWEPEITAKLLRLGYDIAEVPVSYTPRKIEEGKKIDWRDGVMALWTALSWRLRPMGTVRRTMATLPAAAARLKTGSCANRLLLAVMRQEVDALVGDACGALEDCRYVGIGAKPCGGPWEYIIYSTAVTDSAALAERHDRDDILAAEE